MNARQKATVTQDEVSIIASILQPAQCKGIKPGEMHWWHCTMHCLLDCADRILHCNLLGSQVLCSLMVLLEGVCNS